jgi:hypothetical protein
MRELTHYELRVLIKNEIEIMSTPNSLDFHIDYIAARCKEILRYVQEYKQLKEFDE